MPWKTAKTYIDVTKDVSAQSIRGQGAGAHPDVRFKLLLDECHPSGMQLHESVHAARVALVCPHMMLLSFFQLLVQSLQL